MTQKGALFKGQKKRKTIPPNRHGKAATTRKGSVFSLRSPLYLPDSGFRNQSGFPFFPGKRFVKPSTTSKEMELDRVDIFSTCLFLHRSYFFSKSFSYIGSNSSDFEYKFGDC